jgi:anti-sigma B factor antagonist
MSVQQLRFESECEELADGSLLFRAHGEVDMATSSALERALVDCAGPHPRCLIVDLADVPFMDASGLRVLLSARTRQQEAHGELLITHPSRQVARLLQVARTFTELPLAS